MQELRDLEIFEMEVLRLLNQNRMLDRLYFCGGTMLRLCHTMNRYSTDLDFWMKEEPDYAPFFEKISLTFSSSLKIKDAEEKANTLLFEIGSTTSTRNLIVEIRKRQTDFEWERKIAFSPFSNRQIVVKGHTLTQMMKNKVQAFLDRRLIRDCYDIQFLLFRGTSLQGDQKQLHGMLQIMDGFNDRDFKVTLGSLLEEQERAFTLKNRFQFLREEIHRRMEQG